MPFDFSGQKIIQQQINRAIAELLASDPANANYLATLNNTAIAVEAMNPSLPLLLVFADNRLQIMPLREDVPVQLRIRGNTLDLAKLLVTPIDSAARLRQLGIEVTGDVGLLLEMSQLANKIEIDWEYLVSQRLGETPAVLISRASQIARTQATQAKKDMQGHIHSHLRKRANLPTRAELDATRSEIRELGYRLDRLELAIKHRNH